MYRRNFLTAAASLAALPAFGAELGDDGLHKQSFFRDTFLDLSEDLAEARSDNRNLMVLFEQRGCPYCAEMHKVNFARPEIIQMIEEKYFVIQLDLWGAREVVDFEGNSFEERDFAAQQSVNFTPTSLLFSANEADGTKEAFRMPGYFKPFHHLSALEYVDSGAYHETPFQRFLQDKFARLTAEGKEIEVWE